MVVDITKNLLRCDNQVCHFPYCLLYLSVNVLRLWKWRLEHTVSKSIDVNLNSLRKKGGTRMVLRRWEDDISLLVKSKQSSRASLSSLASGVSLHVPHKQEGGELAGLSVGTVSDG